MPTRVNRAEFLQKLQAIEPGLATSSKQVDQANCFIFRNGLVQAYNDEVATSIESGLPEDFVGAVKAAKFQNFLTKMKEEEIEIEWEEGQVVVIGRNGRESGFPMEDEIVSGIDTVEVPDQWKPLPEGFTEAVSIVQECAGNTSQFVTNVVNIHPKWLEAGDDMQLIRYRIRTEFENATMVRQGAIKHISALGMTEFAESETWLHFRNPEGLVYSCRCYIDPPFPTEDITEWLKGNDGEPMTLPKGLIDAVDLAETVIAGDKGCLLHIDLKPGLLKVKARAEDDTWFREPKKIVYNGERLSFMISPKLLKELVNKHNEVLISKDKMRVEGGKWRYLTCLTLPQEDNRPEPVAVESGE